MAPSSPSISTRLAESSCKTVSSAGCREHGSFGEPTGAALGVAQEQVSQGRRPARHCERQLSNPDLGRVGGLVWVGRVGAKDYSSAPLTEPDVRASHPALWIDISEVQREL